MPFLILLQMLKQQLWIRMLLKQLLQKIILKQLIKWICMIRKLSLKDHKINAECRINQKYDPFHIQLHLLPFLLLPNCPDLAACSCTWRNALAFPYLSALSSSSLAFSFSFTSNKK